VTVLVLNCGSSSLKVQILAGEGPTPRRLLRAAVERLGDAARVTCEAPGVPAHRATEGLADHAAALGRVLAWAEMAGALPPVDAVGHRVVHGGARFTRPALVDDEVLAAIEALETLAPLHNAPSLAGLRAARAVLGPRPPMVAVFDTAFHAALSESARQYAIPHELAARHGIRRYGFHGTAFRSALARYAGLTGRPATEAALVALHLGNGCSAAAIRAGRSVDTSMGLTPLEGLVMGTRAGDLDPAIVTFLARAEGVPADEVVGWLNERSGLRGLSGVSRDMRELLDREAADERCRLAVDVFCYRARKYVGAYLAALGGAEAVVFSGGIGERAPAVRARICAGLEAFGLTLDPARNAATVGADGRISADGARLQAWVVAVDEEAVIAADVRACLGERRTAEVGR
jgi:acetate kinase